MPQQPENTGPSVPPALAAAAEKKARRQAAPAARRDRTPPPPPPAPAPAQQTSAKAPQIVEEPPKAPAEGKATGATVTPLPTAQQPPVVQEPEVPPVVAPVAPPVAPPVVPSVVAPVAPPVGQPEVAAPPAPVAETPAAAQPTLATLLRKRPASTLSRAEQQMYTSAIAKLFKSVANIISMLGDRADESAEVIKMAVAAGYSTDEVDRLARTHGIEDWLPFILATEGEQQ